MATTPAGDPLPRPTLHPSVFVAAGARIVGHVTIGEQSSVWFNAVIRADTENVAIGRRTNVQDNCVLHADPGFPCVVGDDVTVGHGAIVHGARVGRNVVIGMGAVVMNGAEIGDDCLVAAGAVVPEKTQIPAGSLVVGVPARVARPLSDAEKARNRQSAEHYVNNARRYSDG